MFLIRRINQSIINEIRIRYYRLLLSKKLISEKEFNLEAIKQRQSGQSVHAASEVDAAENLHKYGLICIFIKIWRNMA